MIVAHELSDSRVLRMFAELATIIYIVLKEKHPLDLFGHKGKEERIVTDLENNVPFKNYS